MSQTDTRSEIKSEYDDAKETARVYLQVVRVLESDENSKRDKDSDLNHRDHEIRAIRRVVVQGRMGEGDFPNDPFAFDAALLGHRYLHNGFDRGSLETLLARERSHPAYREALTIIVGEMRRGNVDLPGPLRRLKQENKRTKERWRLERTRNYRIGLVVEAMSVGNNVLVLCGENERKLRQLQIDLKAVCEQLGDKSYQKLFNGHAFERLQDTGRSREIQNAFVLRSLNDIERILETLNWMNARPWRSCNKGKGLTERDLVKFTNLPLSEGMGVHAISCDNRDKKVRKHFPNLYPTRNEATECKSICDAVAAVLPEAKKRGYTYRNILRAWKAYRDMI